MRIASASARMLLVVVGTTMPGCVCVIENNESRSAVASDEAIRPAREWTRSEAAKTCIAAAETFESAGKFPEAIALYEKGRQADPTRNDLCRRLAVLYGRTGQHDLAKAEYEKAIAMRPNDPDLFADLGYGCFERGSLSEAEKHLRRAIALDPKHARAWINLGLTLGRSERYDEALHAFQQAVPPGPALSNLACVYEAHGKQEEALKAYRQALAFEPGLQTAREGLRRFETTMPVEDVRTLRVPPAETPSEGIVRLPDLPADPEVSGVRMPPR